MSMTTRVKTPTTLLFHYGLLVSLVGFSFFLISFSHQNDQQRAGTTASLELPFVVGVRALMDGVTCL
jgi:nitrate reductase gamma subunit